MDGVVLASRLAGCGYRVACREAIGGGSGVAIFSSLRHSFLLVTAQNCPCAGVDFIVEVSEGCAPVHAALGQQTAIAGCSGG